MYKEYSSRRGSDDGGTQGEAGTDMYRIVEHQIRGHKEKEGEGTAQSNRMYNQHQDRNEFLSRIDTETGREHDPGVKIKGRMDSGAEFRAVRLYPEQEKLMSSSVTHNGINNLDISSLVLDIDNLEILSKNKISI